MMDNDSVGSAVLKTADVTSEKNDEKDLFPGNQNRSPKVHPEPLTPVNIALAPTEQKEYQDFLLLIKQNRYKTRLFLPNESYSEEALHRLFSLLSDNPAFLAEVIEIYLEETTLEELTIKNRIRLLKHKNSSAHKNKRKIQDLPREKQERILMRNSIHISKESGLIKVNRPQDKDHIKLMYWNSGHSSGAGQKSTGHVGLEVLTCQGEYIYASYWPNETAFCLPKKGIFHTKKIDAKEEERAPDKEISISDILALNTEKIISTFLLHVTQGGNWWIWAEYIPRLPFSKATFNAHCSTLVMTVLNAGGLSEHFPSRANFGSGWHLILLCSTRIFITTAFLSCGLYPVIEDSVGDNTHSGKSALGTLIIILANGILIFPFEKKFSSNRHFSEMGYADCFVGMMASLSFGSIALIDKWLERTNALGDWPSPVVFAFDFLFLLFGAPFGLYLGGKLGSFLVNILRCNLYQGSSYTIAPANVDRWVVYLQETHSSKNAKRFIFKRELASISMLYTSWIAGYIVRHSYVVYEDFRPLFSSGILALYVAIPIGIGISYSFTKCYERKIKKELLNDADKEETEKIITTYDGSSGKYALTTLTTTLGIMAVVSLCALSSDLNGPFIISFLSPVGGMLGFCFGLLLYKICKFIASYCFQQETQIKNSTGIDISFTKASSPNPRSQQQNSQQYFPVPFPVPGVPKEIVFDHMSIAQSTGSNNTQRLVKTLSGGEYTYSQIPSRKEEDIENMEDSHSPKSKFL